MIGKSRLAVLMGLALLALLTGSSAQAERRIALVIGNNAYKNLPTLQKATADARSYADMLKSQGFDDVALKTDLTRADLDDAIATFLDKIQPGDTAVFTYSGHGWSDGSQNYIVGIDAPKSGTQELLARISIPLRNGSTGILDDIDRKGAGLKVAIIDACRDNPFTPTANSRAIGVSRGLSLIQPPKGTFVVFSAGTGQTALDGLTNTDPNPNSVFTRVFVPLVRSGLSLQDATKEAQAQVVALASSVNHEQQPAYYDEVLGKACLARSCGPNVQPAAVTPIPAVLPPPPAARIEPPKEQFYYVGPVSPPDPWLALRTDPSTQQGRRLLQMPEGTLFRLLGQQGDWYHVQLLDGTQGWANRNWIRCCRVAAN